MSKHGLDRFKEAYGEEFKFYDENILMLSCYSQRIINTMQIANVKSCMSLGIGHKIVSKRIIDEMVPSLDKYILIEGSREIIDKFKNEVVLPSNVFIFNSFFEEFNSKEKFDVIEMGFILEHVDDPLFILKKFKRLLKPHGLIFLAVPNAMSLHRLIGYEAGLLDNLYSLSKHDLELGHRRYFAMESFIKLIKSSGLKIKNTEGIFLKPFSTSQLKSLDLSPEVLNALCRAGVKYPEISNAIYIETTR